MHISPLPTSPIEQRQLSLPPAVVKSLPHLSLPLPTSLTTVLLQEVYSIAGKNKPIKTFSSIFRQVKSAVGLWIYASNVDILTCIYKGDRFMSIHSQGARPAGTVGRLIGRAMNLYHTSLYRQYLFQSLPPDHSIIL